MPNPSTSLSLTACLLLGAAATQAQPVSCSFSLDDNPSAPLIGFGGLGTGFGAENPSGVFVPGVFPPGLAPSPSLPFVPGIVLGDGDILGVGPFVRMLGLGGFYMSSFSKNTTDNPWPLYLTFSVDRLSTGLPGTPVNTEAGFNQHCSDIYKSSSVFWSPQTYAGALTGTQPFAGFLQARVPLGTLSNVLILNQHFLGLRSAGLLIPAGQPAGAIQPGSHDNLDAFEVIPVDDLTGGNWDWQYATYYWDEALFYGVSPADIWDTAPGAVFLSGVPFATAATMGLSFGDMIDGLIVYDRAPRGGTGWGGPGAEPVNDYVLFSLAPGSPSLAVWGLSPADVMFSDFTGRFAVYAVSVELGLDPSVNQGSLGEGDNVDALDLFCAADITHNGIVDLMDLQGHPRLFRHALRRHHARRLDRHA